MPANDTALPVPVKPRSPVIVVVPVRLFVPEKVFVPDRVAAPEKATDLAVLKPLCLTTGKWSSIKIAISLLYLPLLNQSISARPRQRETVNLLGRAFHPPPLLSYPIIRLTGTTLPDDKAFIARPTVLDLPVPATLTPTVPAVAPGTPTSDPTAPVELSARTPATPNT